MVCDVMALLWHFTCILKASLNMSPQPEIEQMQIIYVDAAYVNSKLFGKLAGFAPHAQLRMGLQRLPDWFIGYRSIQVRP